MMTLTHSNQDTDISVHLKNWKKAGVKFRAHINGPGSWLQPVCLQYHTFWKTIALTLWMVGNFLNIDYIVICFLKPLNSASFRRVTRRLAWIQPVCISINAVPSLKGLTDIFQTDADDFFKATILNPIICLSPGGYYCNVPGSASPNGPCTGGHYCTLGVDTPTPVSGSGHKGTGDLCPAGSYCPTNSTTATQCAAGTYAISTG